MGEDLLLDAVKPYPDVILCSPLLSAQLPPLFTSFEAKLMNDSFLHCAISQDTAQPQAATEFAAYIYVALSPQRLPSEI